MRPASGCSRPDELPHHARLARAIGTEQPEDLTPTDLEINTVGRGDIARLCPVDLRKTADDVGNSRLGTLALAGRHLASSLTACHATVFDARTYRCDLSLNLSHSSNTMIEPMTDPTMPDG